MDYQIFEAYFLGRCDAGAAQRFEQWCLDNMDSAEFDRMSLELLSKMSAWHDRDDAEAAYRRLRMRMEARDAVQPQPRNRRRIAVAAAAAVLVAVVTGIGLIALRGPQQPLQSNLAEYCTAVGQTLRLTLPDSSVIVLKPDSRLVYDRNTFDAERRVLLYGDAYCDIRHLSDSAPFSISCGAATVSVLGTQFDLRSHASDSDFEVILYDGTVRLASGYASHADTLLLRTGQTVRIHKLTGSIDSGTTDGLLPVPDGLQFLDCTLNDIANSLERRYGKHISVADERGVGQRRVFALYRSDARLDNILKSLCQLTNTRAVSLDGNTIVIK